MKNKEFRLDNDPVISDDNEGNPHNVEADHSAFLINLAFFVHLSLTALGSIADPLDSVFASVVAWINDRVASSTTDIGEGRVLDLHRPRPH